MYYSLLIRFNRSNEDKSAETVTQIDCGDLEEIKADIVRPYLEGRRFIVGGHVIDSSSINKIKIVETDKTIEELREVKQSSIPPHTYHFRNEDIISDDKLVNDITNKVISCVESSVTIVGKRKPIINNDVFVVHGRDDGVKNDVARFLEKLGLKPIILHEQANQGKTIIEKIEAYTDVGYGIVLYTPCDVGRLASSEEKKLEPRARQNVVFEHGYLIGKLGRDRVCALMAVGIERPSDISGILYVEYQDNDKWKIKLAQELNEAGYQIDFNIII